MVSYEEYLNSEEWKQKREEAFSHYGRRCQRCGSVENLEVHHLNYDTLGNEDVNDLAVLCHECHEEITELTRGTRERIYNMTKSRDYVELKMEVGKIALHFIQSVIRILADADIRYWNGYKSRHKSHLQRTFWELFPKDKLLMGLKDITGGMGWHEVFLKMAAGTYRDEQ